MLRGRGFAWTRAFWTGILLCGRKGERLWRSVKYEEIYLRHYEAVPALHHDLETHFRFYNKQ